MLVSDSDGVSGWWTQLRVAASHDHVRPAHVYWPQMLSMLIARHQCDRLRVSAGEELLYHNRSWPSLDGRRMRVLGFCDGADFSGVDFRGARMIAGSAVGSRWDGCDLSGADLRRVDLRGADMGGATVSESTMMAGAWVDASTVLPSGLVRPHEVVAMDPGDMAHAPRSDVELPEREWLTSILGLGPVGAIDQVEATIGALSGRPLAVFAARLWSVLGADMNMRVPEHWLFFEWVQLQHVLHALRRAAVQRADVACEVPGSEDAIWFARRRGGLFLHRADLSNRMLRGCNFVGADLSGAQFAGADLAGASLAQADLRGADLSQAVGLDDAELRGSWVDDLTILPEAMVESFGRNSLATYFLASAAPVGEPVQMV